MKYTKAIFQTFDRQKQNKKLIELITKIESIWQKKALRIELLLEFQSYLTYMDQKIEIDLTRSTKREFFTLAVPLEQEFGKNRIDDEFVIIKDDKHPDNQENIPLVLILDNLRSSFNVGSIFRTAECFGVSEILLCGYTATPENPKVVNTAMGTSELVKWQHFPGTEDAINYLKEKNIKVFALETTTHARELNKVIFPKPTALIFGNEALGISKEILEMVDDVVSIPLAGWKNSLNVGVCTAICCYEISKQWK